MPKGNQIRFGVGFDVDKTSLQNLKKSLKEIQSLSSLQYKDQFGDNAFKELKRIKSTAKEVESALEQAFNPQLNTVNLSKFNDSLKKIGVNKIANDFAELGATGRNAFNNLTAATLTTNTKLTQTYSILGKIKETLGNSLRWSVASSVVNSFTGEIRNAFSYVKSLDTSLNDIRIVTGKSADQMDKFAIQANKAAKALGQQTTAYTNAALIYYQQGLQSADADALAATTLKVGNITGQDTKAVSEEITAVMNGYQLGAEQVQSAFDSLAAVAASTASDLEEISTGMSKVASAANAMGVPLDSLNAQLATIVSVTRQAPESVGTALKTIYARMSDLKMGGKDEDGLGLGDVSGQLEQVGISILDETGNLRDLNDVINDVAVSWNTWTEGQRVAMAQVMAGKRQYNNLIALFDNWDMYTKALNTSLTAQGTIEQQNAIYMDSLAAKVKQYNAAWDDVKDSLIDTDSLKDLTEFGTQAVTLMARFIDGIGGMQGALVGLGAVATRIFDKDINNFILTTIKNLQIMKNNAKNASAQTQIMATYGRQFNPDDANQKIQIQNLVDLKDQAREYHEVMTEAQEEEYNNLIKTKAQIMNKSNATAELVSKMVEFNNAHNPNAETSMSDIFEMSEDGIYKFTENGAENLEKLRKQLVDFGDTVMKSMDAADYQFNDIQKTVQSFGKTLGGLKSVAADAINSISGNVSELSGDFETQQELISDQIIALQELRKQYSETGDEFRQNYAQNTDDDFKKLQKGKLTAGQFIGHVKLRHDYLSDAQKEEYNDLVGKFERAGTDEAKMKRAEQLVEFFNKAAKQATDARKQIDKMIKATEEGLANVPKLLAQMGATKENLKLSQDQQKTYDKLVKKIYEAKAGTDEQKQAVQELQQYLNEILGKTGQVQEAADGVKRETEQIEREMAGAKQQAEGLFKAFQMQQKALDFTKAIQGISSIAFGIQGISSAIRVLNDDSMSTTDKFLSVITSLSMALPTTVTGIKKLNDALKLVTITTEQGTVAQNGLNAAMALNPAGLVVAGIAAIVAALVIYNNLLQQTRKNLIENSKACLEQISSQQEEINANKELYESYLQLENSYDGTAESKKKMAEAANNLKGILNDEDIAVANLTGDYNSLTEAIRNANQESAKKSAELAKQRLNETKNVVVGEAGEKGWQNIFQNTFNKGEYDVNFDSKLEKGLKTAALAVTPIYGAIANIFGNAAQDSFDKVQSHINSSLSQVQGVSRKSITGTLHVDKDIQSITRLYDAMVEERKTLEESFSEEELANSKEYQVLIEKIGSMTESVTAYKQALNEVLSSEAYEKALNTDYSLIKTIDEYNEVKDNLRKSFAADTNFTTKTIEEQQEIINTAIDKASEGSMESLEQRSAYLKKFMQQNANATQEQIDRVKDIINNIPSEVLAFVTTLDVSDKDFFNKIERIKLQAEQQTITVNLDLISNSIEDLRSGTPLDPETVAELEDKYTELGKIWDKNSRQYLIALQKIAQFQEDKLVNNYKKIIGDDSSNLVGLISQYRQQSNNSLIGRSTSQLISQREELEKQRDAIKHSGDYLTTREVFHSIANQKLEEQKFGYNDLVDPLLAKDYQEQGDKFADYQKNIQGLDSQIKTLRDDEIAITEAENDRIETLQKIDDAIRQYSNDIVALSEAETEDLVSDADNLIAQAENYAKAFEILEDNQVDSSEFEDLFNMFPELAQDAKVSAEGIITLDDEIVKAFNENRDQIISKDKKVTIENIKNKIAELESKKQAAEEELQNLQKTKAQQIDLDTFTNQYFGQSYEEYQKQKNEADIEGVESEIENSNKATEAVIANWNRRAEAAKNYAQIAAEAEAEGHQVTTSMDTSYTPQSTAGTSSYDSKTSSAKELEERRLKAQQDILDAAIESKTNEISSYENSIADLTIAWGKLETQATAAVKGSADKTKDPDVMDFLDDELDKYHDINIELQKIADRLELVSKEQDKLVRGRLTANLEKQLQVLKKQEEAYRRKLALAQQDASLRAGQLQAKGAIIAADGQIVNYAELLTAKQAEVNALIAEYNGMTKDEQDSYKDKVEAKKKEYEELKDSISKYQEVLNKTIPDLVSNIQDTINEEIDKQISKFRVDIEAKLDKKSLNDSWRDFKAKVIDDIKDTDFLGQAKNSLDKYKEYFQGDYFNIVPDLTDKVNSIRSQLQSIQSTGTSSVYGDNEKEALSDLNKYTNELMKSLEDVKNLEKEIYNDYLSMIDLTQSAFEQQKTMYQQIDKLIQHDMNLIKLVYGQKSYDAFANYYEQQHQNNLESLDFLRKEKDLWEQRMNSAEKGSEEWKKFRDNWINATNDFNDRVEASVQNAIDKWTNASKKIFDEEEKKITGGISFDEINENWDMMQKKADLFLDTINGGFEMKDLERYTAEQVDKLKDNVQAQKRLNALRDEQLNKLKVKDKLTEYDFNRAKAMFDLQLAKIALEQAQQNKSNMRLRRDSQGNYTYQYVADEDQVNDAGDKVDQASRDLYNMDLARVKQLQELTMSLLQERAAKIAELHDSYIKGLITEEEYKRRIENLNLEYEDLMLDVFGEHEVAKVNLSQSTTEALVNLQETQTKELDRIYEEAGKTTTDISQGIIRQIQQELTPVYNDQIANMIGKFSTDPESFKNTTQNTIEELMDADQDYRNDLQKIQDVAEVSFNSIKEGVDEDIDSTQELIENNDDLIDTYEDLLDQFQDVIATLKDMQNAYKDVMRAAEDAVRAAVKLYNTYDGIDKVKSNVSSITPSGGGSRSTSTSGGSGGDSGSTNDSSKNNSSKKTKYYVYDNNDYGRIIGKQEGYDLRFQAENVARTSGSNQVYVVEQEKLKGRSKYSLGGELYVGDHVMHLSPSAKKIGTFNTGGYTGTWANGDTEGKMAMLHQKELVLNSDDTKNILDAVSIIRTIASRLGGFGLKVADMVGGVGTGMLAAQGVQQTVSINADFPNVSSADEIQEAFNNLVNQAAQYANTNRRKL